MHAASASTTEAPRTGTAPPRLLDELDLAIVHALQLDARAPWTRVGAAVGADSATVAKRWDQMRAESLAWLTCWPKPAQWESSTDLAMVVVQADVDIAAICALPWALTIDETSAGIVALVASGGDLRLLGARVRELGRVAGIGQARTAEAPRMHVVAAVLAEDSTWRTRALDARGQRVMTAPAATGMPHPPKPEHVAELRAALAEDPRMSAGRLAGRLGVSEATARRAVDRAAASGRLGLGCDLAMPSAGLRRGAMLWARSAEPHAAGAQARWLPQAYRVLEVVGPASLCVNVRATTLTALPETEHQLGQEIEIVDRWTVLGERKRNGHLLDDWGRSVGRVDVTW
ncbi:MAG: AsnC family protein [Actinobacteria bacterium]|nr:AsnC family protein [Actinomycetota bacterium]